MIAHNISLQMDRTAANASQLVCQLPNELLVPIFTLYGQDSFDPILGEYSWIKLLLVCKHWYDVACATPTLWQNIKVGESSNMKWITLCLIRSAAAEIEVLLCSDWARSDIHSALALNLHRTRGLSLERISSYWSSRLPTLLRRGAASLETLTIKHDTKGLASLDLIFDLKVTSERFPRLHTLYLARSQAPNDAALYSNLCKLTLNSCAYAGTFQNFITNIQSAPRLTYISLHHFLSQFPLDQISPHIPSTCPGPLLRLKNLVLLDDLMEPIYSFISHINFTTEQLSLKGDCDYEQADSVLATILDLLPPTGSNSSFFPSLERARTAELEVHDDFKLIVGEGDELTNTVELEIYDGCFSVLETPLSSGLSSLICMLRPSGDRLVRLTVCGAQDTVHPAIWTEVFQTLTALEEIKLDGWENSRAFWVGLEAASRESETTVAGDRSVPTCPRLRSVVYGADSDIDEVTLEAMVACLEYREMRGVVALEDLGIVYNGHDPETEFAALKEKYMPRLRELVKGNVSLELECEDD